MYATTLTDVEVFKCRGFSGIDVVIWSLAIDGTAVRRIIKG
jgi:hypothetical protein